MWKRLRSIEYGFCALASIGIPFAFANAINSARTGNCLRKRSSRQGRNYAQIRRKRRRGEFKANLVIPLPGRPVCDGISVFGERNLDHSFGDERTRDACPEEILALVNCAGLKHRKDEIAREFFLEIFDNAFRCAGFQRLLFQAVEFFLLADIGAKGDNLRLKIVFEPAEDHRRVEAARICQDDFHKVECFWKIGAALRTAKRLQYSIAEGDFNVARGLHHLTIGRNEAQPVYRLGDWHVPHLIILIADHRSEVSLVCQLNGFHAKTCAQNSIEGVRRTTALQMSKPATARLLTSALGDLTRHDFADSSQPEFAILRLALYLLTVFRPGAFC